MNKDQQEALRKPFEPNQIQKLPVGGTQLDYVSHAWVTDRLLQVDPEWTWEPVGFDQYGLPKLDENGGLWIKLTVCGVTRYGYGEPQGRDAHDKVKGAIGNSLRVAAMRFGIGLDLWQKESLVEQPKAPTKAKPNNEMFLTLKTYIDNCGSIVELANVANQISNANLTDKEMDALRFAWAQRKDQVS